MDDRDIAFATGYRTTIVTALVELMPEVCFSHITSRDVTWFGLSTASDVPVSYPRYVFAQGYLGGKRILETAPDMIQKMLSVNLIDVVIQCERILKDNDRARVCVVGSDSGVKGSFDETYFLAKAALHAYVQERQVGRNQQLVAVSPSIILDSGMSTRRADYKKIMTSQRYLTKGRFVTSVEVARMIKFLLWEDLGYTNNTVVVMDGGKHARMG